MIGYRDGDWVPVREVRQVIAASDCDEPPPASDAPETILEEAQRITSGDRQRDYDHPLPNHARIARLWNAYLEIRPQPGAEISPEDVAFMMIMLKMARDAYAPKRDNLVDVCGYARCIAIIHGYEP